MLRQTGAWIALLVACCCCCCCAASSLSGAADGGGSRGGDLVPWAECMSLPQLGEAARNAAWNSSGPRGIPRSAVLLTSCDLKVTAALWGTLRGPVRGTACGRQP